MVDGGPRLRLNERGKPNDLQTNDQTIRRQGDIERRKPVRLDSRKGFSLLEIVVALGLLSMGMVGVMRLSAFLSKGARHLVSVSTRDRLVQSLVSSIQANPKLYRVISEPVGSIDSAGRLVTERKLSELALAWSKTYFGDSKNCTACPGRMGYVIQPVLGVPGLFQISVRVTSREIFQGKNGQGTSRDYRFLTSLN